MAETLIWLVVYLPAKLGTESDYFIIEKYQFQLTVLVLIGALVCHIFLETLKFLNFGTCHCITVVFVKLRRDHHNHRPPHHYR